MFNLILGDGEVGRMLAADDNIDGVAFTGLHKTGMSIFRHAAMRERMKPVIAEMGGKTVPMSRKVRIWSAPRKGSPDPPSDCRGRNAPLARSFTLIT
ncbi:hypothetical protein ACVWYQ_003540 [Bradyrhizobium sp. USDA 3397]